MGQIRTKVDAENDLTMRTVCGDVTAAEIRTSIIEYTRGKVSRMVLWDFREASLSGISGEDIKALVKLTGEYSYQRPGGKTAMVFSSLAEFGMGRMFDITCNNYQSNIDYMSFTDIHAASDWLGLGQEQAKQSTPNQAL